MTKTVTISEFKNKCLKLLDQIVNSNEELVITKNQKPVAKLISYQEQPKTLCGQGVGQIKILGNIMQSLDTEWDAALDKNENLL